LTFDIELEVRQGGPESPILFNLYLDYVLRVYFDLCDQNQIKFHTTSYRIIDAARQNKRGDKKILWIF